MAFFSKIKDKKELHEIPKHHTVRAADEIARFIIITCRERRLTPKDTDDLAEQVLKIMLETEKEWG